MTRPPRMMQSLLTTFEMPDEIQQSVKPLVLANLDLLPAWMIQLHVSYSPDVGLADMRPYTDYRRGVMRVGSEWLDATVTYRRRTIVHEFMHMQIAPLHILASRLVDIGGKSNDALDTELREQLRTALEQTTSDLEHLTLRLLERGDAESE